MQRVTTVLFDFDGTLADTNQLIADSYLHVLEKYYPGQYDYEKVRPFNGPSLEAVFTGINPEQGLTMVAEYREFNHAHHDQLIQSFPAVPESLAKLKDNGIKLAVVSTKYRAILTQGLELLGLTKYFDVILGGDDCQAVKPDPEVLHLAMEKLKVEPAECVMVGDNWQDIQAGNNANVTSVFVTWSHKTVAEMMPYQPKKIVTSMLELTEWVLSQSN